MRAEEIMTRDPSCVTPDTSLQDAARLMKQENVGVVPVVERDGSKRLVGVLTDRDITVRVVAEGRDAVGTPVREAMTREVRTCRIDDSAEDVMRVMGDEQVRRIPIVDDRGDLVGIVAQADVVRGADDRRAERTVEKISQPYGKHSD